MSDVIISKLHSSPYSFSWSGSQSLVFSLNISIKLHHSAEVSALVNSLCRSGSLHVQIHRLLFFFNREIIEVSVESWRVFRASSENEPRYMHAAHL